MFKLTFRNTHKLPILQERNLQLVTSFIHNALGRNNKFHDGKSNILITPIIGGTYINSKKEYIPNESVMYVNCITLDEDKKTIFREAMYKTTVGLEYGVGLRCADVEFIPQPMAENGMIVQTFRTGIVVKINTDNGYRYLGFEEPEFIPELTSHCHRVLGKIMPNVDTSDLKLEIIENKNNKSFNYILKNCKIKSNVLKLKITCSNVDVIQMLLDVGFGNSKGCGFGMVFPEDEWMDYLPEYNKKNELIYAESLEDLHKAQ